MISTLLLIAMLVASFCHMALWIKLTITALMVLDLGYALGRWSRRDVVYLHLPPHITAERAQLSAKTIRDSYREAWLRKPIVLTVPNGFAITRHPVG